MERRRLGRTNLEVTALGLGGAEIGFAQLPVPEAATFLNAALDEGINFVDTAECYMISEELIGKTIAHRRKDYHLFTKCGHAAGLPEPDWSRELLEKSIARSLQRLQTDCVDGIQLHSCDAATLKKGDVVEVLVKAQKEGKTRFLGYSGDGQDAAFALSLGVFDTLETSISVADQEAIDLLLPSARKQNVGVIAKRPIAHAMWKHQNPDNGYRRPYFDRLMKLDYAFTKGDAAQAVMTALRFTLDTPGVHTAIVGSNRVQQLRENIANFKATKPIDAGVYQTIRNRWKETAEPGWVGLI